ncbi:MAG: hypothetical protein Tsb0034_12050 [Ekhidna sp.]
MQIFKKLSYVLVLLSSISLVAQESKFEKESRLKKGEFPKELIQLLDSYLSESDRVRFYEEQSSDGKTFEVKFTYNGNRYSIEFLENLNLQDIEMEVQIDQVDSYVMDAIQDELKVFDKAKIEKCQVQFTSENRTASEQITSAINEQQGEVIKYELIVSGKKEKWKTYEMLFDENGHLVSSKEVVKRSIDFILY